MGLMDSLMGAAGEAAMGALQDSAGAPGAIGAGSTDGMALVASLLQQAGGLSGLLQQLQAGGLGGAVQSWVGTGANQAISADQLGAALGPKLLSALGVGNGSQGGDLLPLLAQLLPLVVDQLTPQGQLPADNGLGNLGQLDLGSLAGLAGQFLKGR
jgi:uncharacterized protein YidB (DUF937 family)